MLTLLLFTTRLLGVLDPSTWDIPACRVPVLADQLLARAYELQPAVSPTLAHDLALSLAAEAQDARFDPWVGLGIAMQESSLRASAVAPAGDCGLYQFHEYTMRTMNLTCRRLRTDVAYSVRAYARLMAEKLVMCPGPRGWSCYHSTRPRLRRQYERDVGRYLPPLRRGS